MKLPKTIKRHCPSCNAHHPHKVSESKKRGRGTAHTLSWGSNKRIKARGERRGAGNLGRYSKPTKPKMTGKKLTKKTDLRYTCSKCRKTHMQSVGRRVKKLELI